MDQVSFRNEVYSVVASIFGARTDVRANRLSCRPSPVLAHGGTGYAQCFRRAEPSLPPGGKQPGTTGTFLAGTARTIGKGRCRFQKKRMCRPQGMWLGNLERIYFLAKILITNEQLVSKIPVPITPIQPKYCHEVPARKVPVEPPMK